MLRGVPLCSTCGAKLAAFTLLDDEDGDSDDDESGLDFDKCFECVRQLSGRAIRRLVAVDTHAVACGADVPRFRHCLAL